MRRLLLHPTFDHLRAQQAESEAVTGNESSLGASRSADYEPNGAGAEISGERVVKMHRVALTPDRFRRLDGEAVMEGSTDELRAMMGAGPKEISLQGTGSSILSGREAG